MFSKKAVASGNFVVSEKKNLILNAYLGTCIGVSICDRKAKVGGLLHILLPEWTGFGNPPRETDYASSGMPIFIKALCQAGADSNRMEAVIAGGALLGPVSKRDLDLDIGGKTAEVVRNILNRHQINIAAEETGGYFGCQLSLNLDIFNSSIEPIIADHSSYEKIINKPGKEEITNSIDSVRPIPQVALKLARIIREDEYNMDEIAYEMKQDQVICAAVIRVCNSSYLGLKRKIDTIDRALVILGEKMLFQLFISVSMKQFFSESGQGYSLCKGGLFQHALGTAIVAEALAKHTRCESSAIAYTAGLLHDIGKVVLDKYVSSVYPLFYRRIQDEAFDLNEAEKIKIGITHPEAGMLLAGKWSLPENLTDAIRHHHYPENAKAAPELTHLIYLADFLMSRFKVGQDLDYLNTDNFSLRLSKIGLTPSQFPQIIEQIPRKIFDSTI